MAETSTIEWTDATWNPITGCSLVSPGCTHCYAMTLAGTRLKHHSSRAGLTVDTKTGPVWTGEVRLNEAWLTQPLQWRRPRMIFVCAHGDLFHENVPDAWIDRVFAVMALAPQHTFQLLTKRSARMRAYCNDPATPGRIARVLIDKVLIERRWPMDAATWPVVSIGDVDLPDDVTVAWPLRQIWLGVSAEDQRRADERVPDLLATPAAVRWVSAEPLLAPIAFYAINAGSGRQIDALRPGVAWIAVEDWAWRGVEGDHPALDLIVCGDESGRDRREVDLDCVRSIRDQCAGTGTDFFLKQLHIDGRKVGLPLLDGVRHDALPEVRR